MKKERNTRPLYKWLSIALSFVMVLTLANGFMTKASDPEGGGTQTEGITEQSEPQLNPDTSETVGGELLKEGEFEKDGKRYKIITLPHQKYDDITVDYTYEGVGDEGLVQLMVIDKDNNMVDVPNDSVKGLMFDRSHDNGEPGYYHDERILYANDVWGYHQDSENFSPEPYWFAIQIVPGCDLEVKVDEAKKAEGKNFLRVKYVEQGVGAGYSRQIRRIVSPKYTHLKVKVAGTKAGSISVVFLKRSDSGVQEERQVISFPGGKQFKETEDKQYLDNFREYESDLITVQIPENTFAIVASDVEGYFINGFYSEQNYDPVTYTYGEETKVQIRLVEKDGSPVLTSYEFDENVKLKWGDKTIDKLVIKTPNFPEGKEFNGVKIKDFKYEETTVAKHKYNDATDSDYYREKRNAGKVIFNNAFYHMYDSAMKIMEFIVDGEDFATLAKRAEVEENGSYLDYEFKYENKTRVETINGDRFKYSAKFYYNVEMEDHYMDWPLFPPDDPVIPGDDNGGGTTGGDNGSGTTGGDNSGGTTGGDNSGGTIGGGITGGGTTGGSTGGGTGTGGDNGSGTTPVDVVNPVIPPIIITPDEVDPPVVLPTTVDVVTTPEVAITLPELPLEEDIDIDGDSTPRGDADLDIDVLEDENPRGKANIKDGNRTKKKNASTGMAGKILAKTGGLNNFFAKALMVLAGLSLMLGLTAFRKKED